MSKDRDGLRDGAIEVTMRGLGLDEELVRGVRRLCQTHERDVNRRLDWRVSLVRPSKSDQVRASVLATDHRGVTLYALHRDHDVARAVRTAFANLRASQRASGSARATHATS